MYATSHLLRDFIADVVSARRQICAKCNKQAHSVHWDLISPIPLPFPAPAVQAVKKSE